MHFLVLGASAGGGLPQWNCGCQNCLDARAGAITPLTQSSLAVSIDGENWSVLNASPDIRAQFLHPKLAPYGLRETPLRSVLLTNGDIDHIAGLLTLREQSAFNIFATHDILALLEENPIFNAINAELVPRIVVELDRAFELQPGLEAEVFAVPGKVPLFMEDDDVQTDLIGEQTVGVRLNSKGKVAYYIPGCAAVTNSVRRKIEDADLLFFDGTLFDDEEMVRSGTSEKTGQRMGHVSISGEKGAVKALATLDAKKIFIHINNTNPILQPQSSERQFVLENRWGIAEDGMEVRL